MANQIRILTLEKMIFFQNKDKRLKTFKQEDLTIKMKDLMILIGRI